MYHIRQFFWLVELVRWTDKGLQTTWVADKGLVSMTLQTRSKDQTKGKTLATFFSAHTLTASLYI